MYIDIKSTWLVPNSGNQSMDSSPSKSLKVILDVDFHGVFPFVRNAKLQAANQHIGWVSESPNYEPFFWANYGGLSGGQPKWWFSRGMLPKPKSPWFRFRKYSSFSQIFSFEQVRAMTFWPMILLKLLFCLPLPHHVVVLEFKNQAFDMLKRATSTEHNKKWGDKMVTACYLKVSFWFNMKCCLYLLVLMKHFPFT